MIYTLTFNPSLDYIVTVPKFTCGVVNRTTEEIIFPGGKGINVSMVLKNLGFENTALGFYAGFTGMELKRLVADKGIHAEFIPVDKGMTRINVKLRSEQESEINGQGPAIAASDIDKLYEKLDALEDGDILVMAGSIPDVMPQTMYMDIMKRLQGRNLKIVVDATRDLLVNVLPFHPFLIKPNNHELGEIFGVEIRGKEDVVTYAKKLQERGARNVLISMAGDGAVLVAEDGSVYQAEAPKGKLINSVGAGDSMVAGFLAGYLILGLRKVCDKLPEALEKIAPVLIYPVVGVLLMGLCMTFIVEPIMGGINTGLNNALTGMGNSSKVILGLILGGMMAIDMGGPFNKAAYVFGTAAIAAGNYDIMAAVMVGGMTPPCAIALASLLFKDKFTKEEREAGPTNFIMGLAFITEGAIPFAASDPIHVLPSCIVGSAVAGAISMFFNCTLMAPHGGIFVFPVVGNALMYLVALVVGTLISAMLLGVLKKKVA